MTTKRQTKAEFIAFLRDRLIPDLRESGRDSTADDFETAIGFMLEADGPGMKCDACGRACTSPGDFARETGRAWSPVDATVLAEHSPHCTWATPFRNARGST